MSDTCPIEEDNISIQIDPAIFDKPDSQLTEQLYEMARRIAESDRNNEAYRQAKKSKSFQLQTLKHNKHQLESELQALESLIKTKKNMENQNNFSKNNRPHFQQINSMCEDLAAREKDLQKNTCDILKENEKLEKKLGVLQVEYQIMVKQNKHKSMMAAKLAKQKEEKMQAIQKNQEIITDLENQCESSKRRAEELQNELKEELKNEEELQEIIKERQTELETQRRNREETSRKHEENKKHLLKMVNSVKTMENEIQCKFKQAQKLQNVHESLRQKISQMESQQRKLEEFLLNRRTILNNLKQVSSKASKEEESLMRIKVNRQRGDQ